MREVTAPTVPIDHLRIFLAGSIAMGKADPWQDELIEVFKASDIDAVVMNPRRSELWPEGHGIDDPKFVEQVEWELNALSASDLIIMYFDPKFSAPITLLELGLYAKSNKLLVCCPKGFERKGNVDVVCQTYGIPTVKSFKDLKSFVQQLVDNAPSPAL